MRLHHAIVAAALLGAGTQVATAQSLASRIAQAGNGPVTFHFAARAGVCGDGEDFIRMGRSSYVRNSRMADTAECAPGPVQVRADLRNGAPEHVETWVGALRDRNARDLGAVGAAEAAEWLLAAAERQSHDGSDDAILPAVLADSTVPWPALLRIARARLARGHHDGGGAAFWLSRFAAGAANGRGANSLDNDADRTARGDEDDLKVHAVFVMSQLPADEAIPGLLRIAKENTDPRVRASALFWLGQRGGARALDYFEQLLKSAR